MTVKAQHFHVVRCACPSTLCRVPMTHCAPEATRTNIVSQCINITHAPAHLHARLRLLHAPQLRRHQLQQPAAEPDVY